MFGEKNGGKQINKVFHFSLSSLFNNTIAFHVKFDPPNENTIKWSDVFQKSIKLKGTFENSINLQ